MDNQNNRNKQNLPGNNNPNNKNNRQRWNIILFTVMLISFIVFALYQFREDTDAREITYDQFLNMVDSGEVKKVVIEDDKIMITAKTEAEMKNSKKKGASESDVVEGSVADNNDSSSKDSSDDSTGLFSNVTRKQYYTGIVKDDTLSDRLYKAGVEYEQKIPDSTSYMVMNLLVNIVPLVIMIGLGVMLMRRMTKGGGMMGVGKSNAKMYVEKQTGVTFLDVAGEDEAKESLQEVVDFLHNPKKYEANMPWYKDQISNCTYRQFTTGFYFGKPGDESQIYDSNTYIKEYTYLGIIGGIKDGMYRIEQRNKFSVGETIEIMKPDGQNVEVTVEKIIDEDGQEQESAPHPKQVLYVALSGEASVYDILRRQEGVTE